MSKRLISLLLALLMLLTAAGCGAQSAPEEDTAPPADVTAKLTEGTEPADDTAAESSAYLRLYCPADLSDKNKSAGGGDAIVGLPVPWTEITANDRGRQQQAQYIMSCCWAAAPTRTSSARCPPARRCSAAPSPAARCPSISAASTTS